MNGNFFTDVPERVKTLKDRCELAELIPQMEECFGDPSTFSTPEEAVEMYFSVLEEVGKICQKEIKPRAKEIDEQGCSFDAGKVTLPPALDKNIATLAQQGMFGANISRKEGGLNFPLSVQMLSLEMLGQACPNTGLTLGCYSMGNFLEAWGSDDLKKKYLEGIASNEIRTSMALTEPGAGSDLASLRTTAKKVGDHYLVTGNKIFITGGCHELSFALARTDMNATGLNGLSVIVVPHYLDGKENYTVGKIEDKVCLHASPTCEIVYKDSVGYLLGEEGNGFRVMTDLMNSARVAISALATGISVAAMEEAKSYGKTRVSMGKPIGQHPMVAQMIFEMEIETRAMRALTMEASTSFDRWNIAKAKNDAKNEAKWRRRYLRLTPLCKYFSCERALVITRNALQIFGGYGVTTEYPLERLWRETIIYPIYEGTSQIQSLMVLKDTLKVVARDPARFLSSSAGVFAESKVTRDPLKAGLLKARHEFNRAIGSVMKIILKDKFNADIESLKEQKINDFIKNLSLELMTTKTDMTLPFLFAERLTRVACDYYALKCMVDRAGNDEEARYWAQEFAQFILPRMEMENTYMQQKVPGVLEYMAKEASK